MHHTPSITYLILHYTILLLLLTINGWILKRGLNAKTASVVLPWRQFLTALVFQLIGLWLFLKIADIAISPGGTCDSYDGVSSLIVYPMNTVSQQRYRSMFALLPPEQCQLSGTQFITGTNGTSHLPSSHHPHPPGQHTSLASLRNNSIRGQSAHKQ